jgi:hypothetical protein
MSTSVADPGCLSRIPDPDFYPSRVLNPGSRIPDPGPGTNNSNQRGRGKFFCPTFFCSHKYHKIENYYMFELGLQGFGSWDTISWIRKNPIPDPGYRGQKGTGSRIRIHKALE